MNSKTKQLIFSILAGLVISLLVAMILKPLVCGLAVGILVATYLATVPLPQDMTLRDALMNKIRRMSGITVFISIYAVSALIPFVKYLLQHDDTYRTILLCTVVFFILGLIIFFASTETLLRIDRGTGSWLSKLGPFENSGFEYASNFYQLGSFLFMMLAVVINLVALFIE